jgi:DNA repair protein RadC
MQGYKIMLVKEEGVQYPDEHVLHPEIAARLAAGYINNLDRETMIVMALNTRNRIIGVNTVSIGTLDSALCHPREVFKFAILANANQIMLAHNHPSGDTTPSSDDIELTKRLVKAGELIGIELTDHVIIGFDGDYLSMREKGLF